MTGGEYDIVVLDEVLGAVGLGLVSVEQVMGLICSKPAAVELVLTGREAPEELVKAADLVTRMEAVKHPYQRGVKARRGIEF